MLKTSHFSRWFSLLLVLLLLMVRWGTTSAAASDNPYDLLGRVMVPWVAILSADRKAGQDRALSLSLEVKEARGFPVDPKGQRAEIAVEYPDKLRLQVPFWGEHYTIARRGETLWVAPGSKLKALLARPEVIERLPAPDRKYELKPFKLPVPEKDLKFLPILFKAKEEARANVEGIACRVLQLELSPLIARGLDVQGWSGRLWVEQKGERPVQLELTGPNSSVLVKINQLAFSPSLPPETWVPNKEQENDVVLVPPARYEQLLRALLGGKK